MFECTIEDVIYEYNEGYLYLLPFCSQRLGRDAFRSPQRILPARLRKHCNTYLRACLLQTDNVRLIPMLLSQVYLDERHIQWMSDAILQHVLSDMRPQSVHDHLPSLC